MANWRDSVEPSLKSHLEAQINNASRHRAYLSSRNPATAQLWLAIANLSKKIYELQMKVDMIDNTLKESLEVAKSAKEKAQEQPHSEILQIRTEGEKSSARKKKVKKGKSRRR